MYSSVGQTLCTDNRRMMHKWLTDCDTKHISCRKNKEITHQSPFLPTRLICITPGQTCLVETGQFSEVQRQATRCMALSHCWGSRTDLRYQTTSQNLRSRIRGMSATAFPQNIKDAFLVAESFELQYIWIDSICSMCFLRPLTFPSFKVKKYQALLLNSCHHGPLAYALPFSVG